MQRVTVERYLKLKLMKFIGRDRGLRPVDLKGMRTVGGFDPSLLRGNHGARPLTRPSLVPARDLDCGPHEPALGVVRNGEERIYPLSYFKHLVNDVIGGQPTVVSYCERCSSGVAFHAEIDSKVLTFVHFGAYRGSFVARDQQTQSIWTQETGEALAGPLAGTQLLPVPAHLTTVGRWLEDHPGSLGPDRGTDTAIRRSPFGAAILPPVWRETVGEPDPRLPARTLVLGVTSGDASRAYVLDPSPESVVAYNDELGGVPIVVIGGPGRWPLAYARRVGEAVIDLSIEDGRIVGRDGSQWNFEGIAVAGSAAGIELEFVPSHVVEWYSWAASHPATDVVRLSLASANR